MMGLRYYAAILDDTPVGHGSAQCISIVLTLKQLALACVRAVVIEVARSPDVLILAEALIPVLGPGRIVFVRRCSVVVTRGHDPLAFRVAWLCHIYGFVRVGDHGLHARPFESL